MVKVAAFACGVASSGKSTFCGSLISYMKGIGRSCHLVNLDPAAENFEWEPTVDIRDLISLEDVMDELDYGPNGGLIYCFEFLMENLDWLNEELGDYDEDYLIFDMPGQIELYTHVPILPALIRHLQMTLNYRPCALYLLESQFLVDRAKFFAGVLSAMSAMVMLEIPHLNLLSKMDLLKDNNSISRADLKRFMNTDPLLLVGEINEKMNPKFHELNQCIVQLIDDFNMVNFIPLESHNEESIEKVLSYIDDATQWHEDQEPRDPDRIEPDDIEPGSVDVDAE
ncbi:ATP binding protein Fet5 [Schizosaccharomyces octosporus yFS286]|uniref:GPN-loop GTPase 3 n=1 Tax=Schizosaccharomyces octosporus (strain yFS286) TaxID=483514 RepID=S9RMW9_SCHOY|nr:ATP binding protein Fet5 [Schizosaccharomyces octosporus yFS286]EPX75314.1 ATP binding protein Fet5 [Schizosaccharomyces octosporus yFS286]